MSENTQVQKTTVTENLQPLKGGQPQYETWWLIVGLIVGLIILKTFIYIKDKKRHGK